MSEPEVVDYVVVGSGAGGGPVAATLAEAGFTVMLLEAGLDHDSDDYSVPAFHGRASEDPAMSWPFYVRHFDDDEQQRRDDKYVPEHDGVLYPRSGTLGGCTAHNAMITMYPHASDWDGIARDTGDPSWSAAAMRQYFERLEACSYVRRPRVLPAWLRMLLQRLPLVGGAFTNRSRHGFDGWLSTSLADPLLALEDAQLRDVLLAAAKNALADFLGRPLSLVEGLATFVDPNDWRVRQLPEGLWQLPLAVRTGRRNGTRERVRDVAARRPDRLIVRTGSLVTRVLLDDGLVAQGVEYLPQAHAYRADPACTEPAADPAGCVPLTVLVRREVVLAGGAFNTPQLLKLSGIGPRVELERLGIPVRVDAPGVGENLQDRYEVGVVSEMAAPISLLRGLTFAPPVPGEPDDPGYAQWRHGRGVYATNGALVGITTRSRQAGVDPDLFVFGLPARFTGYYPGYSEDLAHQTDVFTWAVLKAHTVNQAGRVLLRSADPRDTPDIRFRYFEEGSDTAGRDLDAVVDGIEVARAVMRRAGDCVRSELVPGEHVATREQLRAYVRDNAWGHHASCTAAMGPDGSPRAVLDSRFRVRGTRGLRVVDASIFPRIPGFFIVTAVYMAAEKAGDALLRDAAAEPTPTPVSLSTRLTHLPRPRGQRRSTSAQETR